MDSGASLALSYLAGPACLYFWFPLEPTFTSRRRVLIWPYVLARSMLTLLALAGGLPPAPPRASVAQINRSGFVIVPVDLLHRQLVLAYQMLIYWVLVLLAGVAIGAIYDLFLARCRLATRVPLTQGEGGHRRIPLRDGKWLARSSGRKRRKRVGSAWAACAPESREPLKNPLRKRVCVRHSLIKARNVQRPKAEADPSMDTGTAFGYYPARPFSS
jgi:hypothetical protein